MASPDLPYYARLRHAATRLLLRGRHAGIAFRHKRVDHESMVELPAPSSGGPLRICVPRTFLDSKVTGRGRRWEREKL